jgi:hypothetical protein
MLDGSKLPGVRQAALAALPAANLRTDALRRPLLTRRRGNIVPPADSGSTLQQQTPARQVAKRRCHTVPSPCRRTALQSGTCCQTSDLFWRFLIQSVQASRPCLYTFSWYANFIAFFCPKPDHQALFNLHDSTRRAKRTRGQGGRKKRTRAAKAGGRRGPSSSASVVGMTE